MIKKRFSKSSLISLLLFWLFTLSVNADIPPDPGFTRVSLSLEIETKEDLSDYRFYFAFMNDLREVKINKGQTSIPSMGGGALYSSGTLWAIPKKSLTNQSNDELGQALREKKITGAIELGRHGFSKTVPEAEAKDVTNPKYRLERDNAQGLKLISMTEESNRQTPSNSKTNEPTTKNSANSGDSSWINLPTIMGGGLVALAILLIGLWLFRRKG